MANTKEIIIEDNDWMVIDQNGEVVNKIREGDKIVRKETQEHLSRYIDNFNKGKNFVKIYDDMMPILDEKLTANEYKLFMQLIHYVSYKDNILRYENKILDMKDMSELIKSYSYDAVRKIVPSLIKKGLIGVHKTGCAERPSLILKCYTVNPYVIYRGTTMDRDISGLFEKSGWDKV